MMDLDTCRFQARTLRFAQLLWYRARMTVLAAGASGALKVYYEARRDIYHAEMVRRWLWWRARIDAWRNRMLLTRTDGSLFQYQPEEFENVRPLVMDLLLSGEYVWWHTGTEQWREFEAARNDQGRLIWNEARTHFLVNVVIYTLADGETTSRVVGTFWRLPAR